VQRFADLAFSSVSPQSSHHTWRENGRVLAVASIYRDLDSLKAELEMERATS
jgi:hypothetical protein